MSIYYPEVAWSTVVSDVALGSIPHRYYVTVIPDNPNDPGSSGAVKAVGDWLIDFIGRPYQITAINVGSEATRVEVYDVNEVGNGTQNGPYLGQIGYIYRPKNGAFMLTQAQLRRLDASAPDLISPIEKGVIWGHRGVALGTNLNITKLSLSGISGVVTPDGGWQGGSLLELGVLHNSLPDLNTGSGLFYHWNSDDDGVSLFYDGDIQINGNLSISTIVNSSSQVNITSINSEVHNDGDATTINKFHLISHGWGQTSQLELVSRVSSSGCYTEITDYSAGGLLILAEKLTLDSGTFRIPRDCVTGYFLKCIDEYGTMQWSPVTTSFGYKGTWDASSNTPTLADGTGTDGWWYRCVAGGTVNFGSGNITFSSGDDVAYNGTIWERIPAATYTLVTATDSILGGVKIGDTINISLGIINVIYGVTAGTACEGNDSRLSDARTPTAHTLDSHSNVTITSNTDGEILRWNGSAWVNNTLAEAGVQGVITGQALTKVNDTNVTLTIGGTPNTSLLQAVSLTLGWTGTLADGRIASASTWNSKQNGHVNLTSLSGLTYASLAFVKMSAAGTFSLDTNTYSLSNHTHTHSSLTDLANDDHTQYHTNARGDARYEWKLGYPGADGYVLTSTAGGVRGWVSVADMVRDGDFTSQGIMLRGASAGVYSILTNNSSNWNTAYGWGNHAGLYTPIAHKTTEDALNGLVKCNGVGGYSAITDNSTTWNSLVSFPGFGTDHTHAAYGDHNHTGFISSAVTEFSFDYSDTYANFTINYIKGSRQGNVCTVCGLFTVSVNAPSPDFFILCKINSCPAGGSIPFAVNARQIYEGSNGYINTTTGYIYIAWGKSSTPGEEGYAFNATWITP